MNVVLVAASSRRLRRLGAWLAGLLFALLLLVACVVRDLLEPHQRPLYAVDGTIVGRRHKYLQ